MVIEPEKIPIMILFKNKDWKDEKECLYLYATLSLKESFTCLLQNQYVHISQGAYQIQDLYGTQDESSSESQDCVVCLSEPRAITLLPCRHFCVCHTCFLQIDKCPICRDVSKAFLVMKENTQGNVDNNTQIEI